MNAIRFHRTVKKRSLNPSQNESRVEIMRVLSDAVDDKTLINPKNLENTIIMTRSYAVCTFSTCWAYRR